MYTARCTDRFGLQQDPPQLCLERSVIRSIRFSHEGQKFWEADSAIPALIKPCRGQARLLSRHSVQHAELTKTIFQVGNRDATGATLSTGGGSGMIGNGPQTKTFRSRTFNETELITFDEELSSGR